MASLFEWVSTGTQREKGAVYLTTAVQFTWKGVIRLPIEMVVSYGQKLSLCPDNGAK